ncbi:alpha/beta hydrolase family protein [Caulobacter sp. ErkDOM-E]|uniref:alpha/beta hydrolase family protein n=1 Tax=Caulobacter sp. ErkDOM-E TaxID=3402778 RepID=UPI003AF49093
MFGKNLAVAAACVAISAGTARAEEKIPLAAYGRLPNVEGIEISPDGKMLAVTVTNGEHRVLTVRKTDGTSVAGLNMGAAKLRDVQWAGQDHLVVIVSQAAKVADVSGPQHEYFMAMDFNLTTGKQTGLLNGKSNSMNLAGAMNVVLAYPMIRTVDGAPHAFLEGIRFVDNVGVNTLYRVNLANGLTRITDYSGEPNTDGWLVDTEGKPAAMSLYDQEKGVWLLKLRIDERWQEVERVVTPMGSYGLSGFGRDGKSVLVSMTNDKNESFLREYGQDGSKTDLPQLGGLLHDPNDLKLLGGVNLTGDDLVYSFFDAKSQATWNAVTKAFKGSIVGLASWSQDRRKVVVRVDSPVAGPGYALVDLDAKSANWLGNIYLGVPPQGVSPVKAIRYKAKDGLEISGYLTLPRGKAVTNLPLVVLPHGGPEGRDSPGFDWWAQALASRGYAVLQPNFRGSEGFGWDFVKAGFGEWGKKMQTDLSDGVRDLAAQGLIDPKRVCIVGGSYGGYAALAGATLDKDVYRCAVSIAGPSDLQRMLQDNQRMWQFTGNSTLRYWLRFMGGDRVKDPDLAAISPARLADKVEIPILLIHGKDDTVVPYVQSQIMASALKKAGKSVELVTLEGEDHWLSSGATRLTMLTSTVDFLEKHNPPN